MTTTKRPVRSYVIRTGRMTPGQKRALVRDWPDFGLDVDDNIIDVEHTFGNANPLVVEAGFGMGESLAEMALANPAMNFIGIEVHRPGVGHLLRLAREAELTNLKVFCADAIDVLSHCIPPAAVHRVLILFPDPWPKKRHHKRRLIDAAFVALVESRLTTGGVLHIATDWKPYADEITAMMTKIDRLSPVRPPERPVTKYERRGRRLGHEVTDVAFQKSVLAAS